MWAASRWPVAIVAVLALALSACSTATTGQSPALPASSGPASVAAEAADSAAADVAHLRALPFTGDTVAGLAGVLARSGVEVVGDFNAGARAPVRVTNWQLENMAAELANGSGITGRTLAAVAPVPRGAPPVPFLVVAWMLAQATPAARFAHASYAGQDLTDAFALRFPDGVLALFLADATAGTTAPTASNGASRTATSQSRLPRTAGGATVRVQPVAARADLIDAPCSTLSNFVQEAIQAVANALTIKTASGGFLTFLAAIWNTAVRLASSVVSGLIKTLTKPILTQLVAVFNAVAAVQQISSVLIAWRAPLTPNPPGNRFGIAPEEVTGAVAMQLQPHILPVPAAVKDCAASVGVDISATAKGSALTWATVATPRSDLATKTSADTSLDVSESATLQYRTGQETADDQADPEQVGTFAVSATLSRNDVAQLRQLISQLLLTAVPPALQSLMTTLSGPILNAATSKLAELSDVHSQTQVPITFHASPDKCRKGKIGPGTYVGPVDKELRGAGGVTGHTSGTVTIVVDPAGAISGSVEVTTDAQGGGISSHAIEKSRISGSTSQPRVTVAERIVDGKDLTTSNATSTPAMRGLCPPAIRWNLASLAPGVKAVGPDGWNVVATRTD